MLTMGSVEVGCIYTSILFYVLMTVAFHEMIKVRARQELEEIVQIKTHYVQWFFYCCIQFFMITRTWLTQDLLY